MKCPHDGSDLRIEVSVSSKRTGYCSLCAYHFDTCGSVQYMMICDLIKGHEGPHKCKYETEWYDNSK